MARKLPHNTEFESQGQKADIDLDRAQKEIGSMAETGVGLAINVFTMPDNPDGEPVAAVIHVQGEANTKDVLAAIDEVAERITKEHNEKN